MAPSSSKQVVPLASVPVDLSSSVNTVPLSSERIVQISSVPVVPPLPTQTVPSSSASTEPTYEDYVKYKSRYPGPLTNASFLRWLRNNGEDKPSFKWSRPPYLGGGTFCPLVTKDEGAEEAEAEVEVAKEVRVE
ncbi:uncharacterized protein LOC136092362 [Hydra vulgaris]|uniref:Uncharacterized protein LOC136092362 n=1 Tax=Hydra vulgaris TaxID=6087 RepID=A0ABM4DPJ4_HYDVU